MNKIIFAGGSKGLNARADGNGSFIKRGYYIKNGSHITGPFDTKAQAELIDTILSTPRLHESELVAGELLALRALRRKGIVATVGLYINRQTPSLP